MANRAGFIHRRALVILDALYHEAVTAHTRDADLARAQLSGAVAVLGALYDVSDVDVTEWLQDRFWERAEAGLPAGVE